MKLEGKNVSFLWACNSPYPGRIIPLFEKLSAQLKAGGVKSVSWVFPTQSAHRGWIDDIKKVDRVFFTNGDYSKAAGQLVQIFSEVAPDIIHTNFEAYGVPAVKALRCIGSKCKVVFHGHDWVRLKRTGPLALLKQIRFRLLMWRHYHWYGKNAYVVGVSPEVASVIGQCRSVSSLSIKQYDNETYKKLHYPGVMYRINGLVMDMFDDVTPVPLGEKNLTLPTFTAFVTQPERKGADVILCAADLLWKKGVKFKLILTYIRREWFDIFLKDRLGLTSMPEWLELKNAENNIAPLLERTSCFISAARGETMSLAIAEATYFLTPVIQSDIPGTYWNSKNPSAFLFKDGDYEDLANKMESFIQADKKELEEKCEVSKHNNEELLSPRSWCEDMVQLYERILGKSE